MAHEKARGIPKTHRRRRSLNRLCRRHRKYLRRLPRLPRRWLWGLRVKTGGRLVRHARRLVFQLAEVLVSREMLAGMLERIGRLRLAPG